MKPSDNTPNPQLDDRLADFTDRALAGTAKQTDPHADDDLRDLEQTILRLQKAFPEKMLDEADVKRMQVGLNARIRKERQKTDQPFWKAWFGSWQSQQSRQQTRLVLSGVLALIVIFLAVPFLNSQSQNVVGTAGLSLQVTSVAAGLVILTGLLVWWMRRK